MTTRITVNVAKSDHNKGTLHTHNRRQANLRREDVNVESDCHWGLE